MTTSPDVLAQVVLVSPWPDELVQVDAHPNPEDRYEAALWARQLLSRNDWVVVDTETTGLGATDQVVQVSVVDPSGRSLVDTLVQPTCEIHPMASKVHRLDRKKSGFGTDLRSGPRTCQPAPCRPASTCL